MHRHVFVALALAACHASSDAPAPAAAPGAAPRAIDAAVAAIAPKAGSDDPWNRPAPPDDSGPSMVERHALADKLCPKVTGPAFYKIEKGAAVSYILGTRHLSVSLDKFPPIVREQARAAKLGVFEIAPGDDDNTHYPELALRDRLGPALWKHYVELVGTAAAAQVETGRPSSAILSMMALYEDVTAQLDDEVVHEVQAGKAPTRGLETAKFQDDLIDVLLDERMLRAEIQQTKDRAEIAHDSADDLTSYCKGTSTSPGMTPKERADMIAAGYTQAELDKMDEQLVYARNRSWIPKLEPLLTTGGVFIAVGADHLIGERGVVALLTARGFKLTPLGREP